MHVSFSTGLLPTDVASLILRWLLGVFFLLARFRWFYDPSCEVGRWNNPDRKFSLALKLAKCGYPMGLAPLVAISELGAALGLLLGAGTIPSTLILLAVLLFATWCTAAQKVWEQSPVDAIDCVACYLWRVEGPYIAICVAILALGPGQLSLDWVLGW